MYLNYKSKVSYNAARISRVEFVSTTVRFVISVVFIQQ